TSGCRLIPCASRLERSSLTARSRPCVTWIVLEPYAASTIRITPGCPRIVAAPMAGAGASTTLRHVSQRHVRSLVMDPNPAGELRSRKRLPFGFENDSLVRRFQESRTTNSGGLPCRGHDVFNTQFVLNELLGIELELNLADITPDDFDSGYTGDCQEARF